MCQCHCNVSIIQSHPLSNSLECNCLDLGADHQACEEDAQLLGRTLAAVSFAYIFLSTTGADL